MAKKLKSSILPLIAYAVTSAIPGGQPFAPAAAAAVSGGQSYAKNHNIGQALLAAGGSYVGSKVGGNLGAGPGNGVGGGFGGSFNGTIGNALNANLGPDLASSIGSVIGPSNFGANLGSTLGSFAGSSVGTDLASSLVPQTSGNIKGEGASAPFKASKVSLAQTPFSLQSYGSLDPNQLSSNIATGGVYGGGQGQEEQNYFLDMINNKLVDDAGNVDQNLDDVNPIESSYLAQLGLGGYGNANSLLEAIYKKKQAA